MRVAPALAFAFLFAAVAASNAVGAFHGIDERAVRHLMPGLDPEHAAEPSLVRSLMPFGGRGGHAQHAADIWLYPASVPVSVLLVGICGLVLLRRRRVEAAVLWPAALVAAVAVEVLVKDVVRRPALVAAGHHIVPFDSSLPSGHALRASIVAAALTYVWRRAGAAATAWALSVFPLLVVAGWHTPSDVLAGVLLALTAVCAVVARLGPR